jgi:hypothetical protein
MDWPPAPELVIRVCVALIGGIGTAFYGLHIRRLGIEAAEGRRAVLQADTISLLDVRIRTLEETVAAKDRDYESCQRRLAEVERQLNEVRWRSGMVG